MTKCGTTLSLFPDGSATPSEVGSDTESASDFDMWEQVVSVQAPDGTGRYKVKFGFGGVGGVDGDLGGERCW